MLLGLIPKIRDQCKLTHAYPLHPTETNVIYHYYITNEVRASYRTLGYVWLGYSRLGYFIIRLGYGCLPYIVFLLVYDALELRLNYFGIMLQPHWSYVGVMLKLRRSDVRVT